MSWADTARNYDATKVTWGVALGTVLMGGVFFCLLFFGDGGPFAGLEAEGHTPYYGEHVATDVAPTVQPTATEPHIAGAYYPEDHPDYAPPEHWDPLLLAVAGGGAIAVIANITVFGLLSLRRRRQLDALQAEIPKDAPAGTTG